jgi:hypothetical protein
MHELLKLNYPYPKIHLGSAYLVSLSNGVVVHYQGISVGFTATAAFKSVG